MADARDCATCGRLLPAKGWAVKCRPVPDKPAVLSEIALRSGGACGPGRKAWVGQPASGAVSGGVAPAPATYTGGYGVTSPWASGGHALAVGDEIRLVDLETGRDEVLTVTRAGAASPAAAAASETVLSWEMA